MTEGQDFIKIAWDIAKYPIVLSIGLIGWIGKRQINRIDAIEKKQVTKDDFNHTLKLLRDDLQGIKKSMDAGFSNTNSRIDKINDK